MTSTILDLPYSRAVGINPMRRGLVIAGGGAKGAYHLGYLKAFHEAEIEFVAVSGTSAGALNAIIWASGEIERGEELWSNVSFLNTFKPSRIILLFGRRFAKMLGTIIVMVNVFLKRDNQFPLHAKHDRILLLLSSLLKIIASTGTLIWIEAPDSIFYLFLGYSIFTIMAILSNAKEGQTTLTMIASQSLLCPVYVVPSLPIYTFMFENVSPIFMLADDHASFLMKIFRTIAFWIGLFVTIIPFLLSIVITIFIVNAILERFSRISIFDSRPLRETIRMFIKDARFTVPTFVTIAEHVALYDPDRPKWFNEGVNAGGRSPVTVIGGPWRPDPVPAFAPSYINIEDLSAARREDVILASASLPLGIVQHVTIDGIDYIDGGIADNFPINPLLEMELDEIFVLLLDNETVDHATGLGISDFQRCKHLRRVQALKGRSAPPSISGKMPPKINNDPPTIVPYPSLAASEEIVLISPKTACFRGLLGGSLAFDKDFTTEWIAAGYNDAVEFLRDRNLVGAPLHESAGR